MRFRPRTDATQRAIVEALRKAGCSVLSLAGLGAGVPDLLVGVAGRTYLIDCKSPRSRTKTGKAATLRERATLERQSEWAARWDGCAISEAFTPEEALQACGLMDAR